MQTYETSTLGAAIATFVAAKEFNSVEEATKAMVHQGATFEPNEVAHQKYEYLYKKVYLNMFPQLKDIYKDIKKFNRKY